jgi:hypothetical protein
MHTLILSVCEEYLEHFHLEVQQIYVHKEWDEMKYLQQMHLAVQ